MLLIDNNLSTLPKNILDPHFAGTQHVFDINLGTASDTTIWQFAKDNGYTILTKDKDFYFRVSLMGAPPQSHLDYTRQLWEQRADSPGKKPH